MNKMELQNMFKDKSFGKILFDEPMKNHTTFKIGGPADVMIIPTSEEELINSVKFCRENKIDYFIMGNGSNLLVKDGGIRGVVIKVHEGYNNIKVNGSIIYCEAGALLSVSKVALKQFEKLDLFQVYGTIGG